MSRSSHWPIEEFARAVLGSSSKHKAVAVLVGYFDESGISKQDHVAVAGGAVADAITWSRIERPWKRWLAAGQFSNKEISCFHAVDCEHGEGEFSSMDQPFRDALAWNLSNEIGKIQPRCFAAGVVRKDWPFAPADLRKAVGEDPYYLSVALCIEQIVSWSRQHAGGEPVALIFAKQSTLNRITAEIHSEYFPEFAEIGHMGFASPQLVIPLQVADFVAYESYRYCADEITKPNTGRRGRLWENLEKHGCTMDLRVHNRNTLPLIGKRGP